MYRDILIYWSKQINKYIKIYQYIQIYRYIQIYLYNQIYHVCH